jgi:hypothetical protein
MAASTEPIVKQFLQLDELSTEQFRRPGRAPGQQPGA